MVRNKRRPKPLKTDPDVLRIERELWDSGCRRIAGTDEAGRGSLAGPVVAAAVILEEGIKIPGVSDSKKLRPAARAAAFDRIYNRAVAVGVGVCSPAEIDMMNILWAALEAMRRAVANLSTSPDIVLVDGDRCFPHSPWPQRAVVGGDARSHTIAAASVIAKVTRDRLMHQLHEKHPAYGWRTNVGYPTSAHYDALATEGPTPHHRQSFRLTRR